MGEQLLTYIARIQDVIRGVGSLPDGYTVHVTRREDIPALAQLYYRAYGKNVVKDHATAIAEIEDDLAGVCGTFWPEASPVVFWRGQLVGAVHTVREAVWDDTPVCPFIIQVMIHKDHRRRGLAKCLIRRVAATAKEQGAEHLALRVIHDNLHAIRLYDRLGFAEWDSNGPSPVESGSLSW